MNPTVIAFFRETLQRLKSKSPAFFRVFQFISASLTFAGYLPSILQRWGVHVDDNFAVICSDVAKIATGVFLGACLTADTKPVAVTDDGKILQKTEPEKMPFTAQAQKKAAEKELRDKPMVEEVVDMTKEEAAKQNPEDDTQKD